MASIRALLFDFGGTLDHPVHWLDRFAASYRACGIDLDHDQLDPAFDYATRTAYQSSERLREWALGETVCFLVGLQLEHLKHAGPRRVHAQLVQAGESGRLRLRDRISEAFSDDCLEGMARSREILEALKPDFRLGVVSNFYGNLDRVLDEGGLLALMDVTVDSSRVGIFKPDPRIFEKAMAALKDMAEPAETAMVGDSPEKDCAPARRAGMKTIWLCGGRQSQALASDDFADHRIHALDELLKLEWSKI